MCQAMQKYNYCTLHTNMTLIFIYKDIYLQHIQTNMIMAKVT